MYATMFTQALGPTETEIMHQLWDSGPATASELHEALKQARPIAYNTVKTTVDRLCEKGIVTRETLTDRKGDPYLYTPSLTPANYSKWPSRRYAPTSARTRPIGVRRARR